MPNNELVLIEWVDSAQPDPSWRHLDNMPDIDVGAMRICRLVNGG